MLECDFIHERRGNIDYYHAYTKEGHFYMCSAQKKRMNFNFTISLNYRNFDHTSDVLAILKSNLLGTEFNLSKMNEMSYTTKFDELEYTLGAISYEFNIFGIRGPRKMKIFIPQLDDGNKPLCIRKINVNIASLYRKKTHL
jgi:hypothetical protein